MADAKDGFIECLSYEDRNFDLKRIELDKGTQVREYPAKSYSQSVIVIT